MDEADAHLELEAIGAAGTICCVGLPNLTVQELVDRRRGNAVAAGVFVSANRAKRSARC